MKTSSLKFIFVIVLLVPRLANAYLDFNAFYMSDGFTSAAEEKSTSMFIEGSIGLSIDKKKTYMVGWSYSQFSVSSSDTASAKYKSTQMGPRFLYRFGKEKNWSVGFNYNLITKATYDDGSGSELKWEGSAIKFDFGYSFFIGETQQFGVRGNYSGASYNEQLDASDAYSKVSFKRTHMYPSLYYTWIW